VRIVAAALAVKVANGEPQSANHAERLGDLDRAFADRPRPLALGTGKGYASGDFVMECREREVTPHVAQNQNGRGSAIDGRTTRHAGNAASQRVRKNVSERSLAWRRQHRTAQAAAQGLPEVDWQFTLAMAAYDLVRIPKLLAPTAA
jgi:hypothetical protein